MTTDLFPPSLPVQHLLSHFLHIAEREPRHDLFHSNPVIFCLHWQLALIHEMRYPVVCLNQRVFNTLVLKGQTDEKLNYDE